MDKKTYNALDYVYWRGDLTFDVSPVNELDVFLCSQLSYPDYTHIVSSGREEITIGKTVQEYFEDHPEDIDKLGVLQSEYVLPMLRAMGKSERFKDAVLCGYNQRLVLENAEQFSAVTIRLKEDLNVVAFRGTDDTIVGWKEDFNIAIMDQVPAQKDALTYLCWVADTFPGKIITVGHSKGGNLSVYAAAMAPKEIRDRILYAYSMDGPGFRDEFLTEEGYLDIKDRTYTIVSQQSIVGMLLNMAGHRNIVHSNVDGPYAHDGFNWEVEKTQFQREPRLSTTSVMVGEIMNTTLDKMPDSEKKEFADSLFDALMSTGAVTISDYKQGDLKKTLKVLLAIRNSEPISKFTGQVFKTMKKYGKRTLEDTLKI